MKSISEKIIVILLLIICFNIVFSPTAYAYTKIEALNIYKAEIEKIIDDEITNWAKERNSEGLVILLSIEEKTELVNNYLDELRYDEEKLPAILDGYDCYEQIKDSLSDSEKAELEQDVNDYIENFDFWEYINERETEESPDTSGITLEQANNEFKEILNNLIEAKEKELAGLDRNERNKKINEHLESLVKEIENKYGTLYNQVEQIGDRLREEGDKLLFINTGVINIITEQIRQIEEHEEGITLAQAEEWLNEELEKLMDEKQNEFANLDSDEKEEKIKEYFNKLTKDLENEKGEFYKEIIQTANSIKNSDDRVKFLNKVISIIERYVDSQTFGGSGLQVESEEDKWGISLSGIVDGALGFLTYPWKRFFIVPGMVSNLILTEIAAVGNEKIEIVTLEDILFNNLSLTDVNIFSMTTDVNGNPVSDVIQNIRKEVAGWYYAFRNFAIVASLAVLIYIGIRMAIANIAEQKAEYKKMLVNWAIGFGLIFVLHYIIVIVLNANTLLVRSLSPTNVDGADYMDRLLKMAFGISLSESWGAIIIYSILEVITFLFLMSYIKRMLMVCFLTMIAPLISVSYAIDKSGNNKSEALNTWLKEFCYNVLIQPFQCIIYIVFVGTAVNAMYQSEGLALGTVIFAIACTLCIFMGERIIRTIFGFNKSKSVIKQVVAGTIMTNAINDVQKVKSSMPEEEEEEVPSPVMPGGKNTYEAIAEYKGKPIPNNNKQENSNKENKPKSEKMQKINEKTPLIVKDIGKAYVKSAIPGAGRSTQVVINKPKISNKELFKIASEDYRKAVNPNMTDKELASQMEAIMHTPANELKDSRDAIYKIFIEDTEKNLLAKGYANPTKEMKKMIDNSKNKAKSKNNSKNGNA